MLLLLPLSTSLQTCKLPQIKGCVEEKEHACIINIYIRSRVCIIAMNLIGEHFDLLQNGVSGSTSLSSSGERHDTETAHVLTASHYRAVTEERWEAKGRE